MVSAAPVIRASARIHIVPVIHKLEIHLWPVAAAAASVPVTIPPNPDPTRDDSEWDQSFPIDSDNESASDHSEEEEIQ